MEKELSDHELEKGLYSMLYNSTNYNQPNVNDYSNKKDEVQIDILPRTNNIRRYWHTSEDKFSPHRRINTTHKIINIHNKPKEQDLSQMKTKSLELDQLRCKSQESLQTQESTRNEKQKTPENSDLSILQINVPQNLQKTIEILDNEDSFVVNLDSSDEDEVIEVALPPKPTITIESSDDEGSTVLLESPCKNKNIKLTDTSSDRAISSSPVPSIVSSVSDEFIRGDCIALNISSRHPNNESFDFSLHGSDLNIQKPSKKRKKNKNKDTVSSTPVQEQSVTLNKSQIESCFATPNSKAKKKKKAKTNRGSLTPQADPYDSDSNHSLIDKIQTTYVVTEKSLPSTDVYESDSNQSEQQKEQKKDTEKSSTDMDRSKGSVPEKPNTIAPAEDFISIINSSSVVDLTAPEPEIDEHIVMGNVSGLSGKVVEDFNQSIHDTSKLGSTKIPAILCEDLDFDNLKGNARVCKRRRYSLTTLRAEMDKFYNESWGGENFNHREIQKSMSRDKNLWVIDPKDRMPSTKRKVICNYCNRAGHRDEMCRAKPPVCYMCGSTGHYETRCPYKICVNCGSPNHIYSNVCRNCANWRYIRCSDCGQGGHPASHCPDLWRRYHDTTDLSMSLQETRQTKKHFQHFCSGCTRRGHLVHTCRNIHSFSSLPINSPYVFSYKPLYLFNSNQNMTPNIRNSAQDTTIDSNPHKMNNKKRQSKSPVVHDTHQPKRRSICLESSDGKTPENLFCGDKNTQNELEIQTCDASTTSLADKTAIDNGNLDEQGHMIQDNEVSDTSEAVTSARIYLTNELKEALITDEGKAWLDNAKLGNHITLESNNGDVEFLNIRGTVGNQATFQTELREWAKTKQLNNSNVDFEENSSSQSSDIPKNKTALLRKLNRSLNSLKKFLGEPHLLYKELMYHQNRRGQLLKEKVISDAALGNNRDNIRGMTKKLNMVLLGQAGLAGGLHHLHQLHLLQQKISNLRQQNVSQPLRNEIGKHFHCIFSALPRDDYAELVQKYSFIKDSSSIYKKKNNNPAFPVRPKQLTVVSPSLNTIQKKKKANAGVPTTLQRQSVENMYKKLIFSLNRVKHHQPSNLKSVKVRNEIDQKLRVGIAKLGELNRLSPKIKKKMKKIQEEAQSFLSTV